METKRTSYIYCTINTESKKVLEKRRICTPALTVIVQGSRSTMVQSAQAA